MVAIGLAWLFYRWLVNTEILHSVDFRSRDQVALDLQYGLEVFEAAIFTGAFCRQGWEVSDIHSRLTDASRYVSLYEAIHLCMGAKYLTEEELEEFQEALEVRNSYYRAEYPSTRSLRQTEESLLSLAAQVRERLPVDTPFVTKPVLRKPL